MQFPVKIWKILLKQFYGHMPLLTAGSTFVSWRRVFLSHVIYSISVLFTSPLCTVPSSYDVMKNV